MKKREKNQERFGLECKQVTDAYLRRGHHDFCNSRTEKFTGQSKL